MSVKGRTSNLEAQGPPHLPKWPVDPEIYLRLYSFNQGVEDHRGELVECQEIRIPPGRAEVDVYRLLPSSPDFEHSGYLTKTRIRFTKGDAFSAGTLMSKPCTFHSHPTRLPLADIPSLKDVHSFLNYRHLRTITVGATKIWAWDKTRGTLGAVRRMAAWVDANHFRVVTRLMKKDFFTWQERYVEAVMKALGWVSPATVDEMKDTWPKMLRDLFKIKVRVFPRVPGAKAP